MQYYRHGPDRLLPPKSEILTNSQLLPYVNHFNTLLSEALPKEMRDQFLTRSRELQKEWEQKSWINSRKNSSETNNT